MNYKMDHQKRGQTLVEFALVLPILLLLSVVIFDFGRVIYYSSAIHNAAREGARYGIVHPNDDDILWIENTAADYAIGLGLDVTDVNVEIFVPVDILSFPPASITVTVTYDFIPATPLVANFLPDGHLTITGEAEMKLEKLPEP
jgi:Flp pilus assembly protein TadG